MNIQQDESLNKNKVFQILSSLLIGVLLIMGAFMLSITHTDTAEAATLTVGRQIPYDGWSTNIFTVDGNMAYCMNPQDPTPANGTYTAYKLMDNLIIGPDQQYTSGQDSAAWLYFAYDGPGFEQGKAAGLWPSTWYDGSAWTPDRYRVMSHILWSNVYQNTGAPAYYGCSQTFKNWYDYYFNAWSGNPNHENSYMTKAKNIWFTFSESYRQAYRDCLWMVKCGNGTQNVGWQTPFNPKGNIELQKVSANTSITDNNPCYTLAGIVYGVYADAACTNEVATLVLNSSGYAKSADIKAGTYYVKEKTANDSYSLSSTVYTTVVKGGQTTRVNGGTVKDNPVNDPGTLTLAKYDGAKTYASANLPQNKGSLEHAKFEVKYYKTSDTNNLNNSTLDRTWIYETDNQGFIYFDDPLYCNNPEGLYTKNGIAIYPLGTYTIQETESPDGYYVNDALMTFQVINDNGNGKWVQVSGPNPDGFNQDATNTLKIAEKNKYGSVEVYKVDAENTSAQGDASLEGISFDIVNEGKNSVVINGQEYKQGEVCYTITTDANGYAATPMVTDDDGTERGILAWGDYSIHESKTNDSMLIDGGTKYFSITDEKRTVTVTFDDHVVRGNVEVYKGDAETNEAYPLLAGDAKLDATFQVVNKSVKEVWVQGTKYAVGDVVYEGKATQNDDGFWSFKTPARLLPYGTYEIIESQNATGYNGTDETLTFQVRKDGETTVFGSATDTAGSIENQIVRTDVTWQKKSDTDGTKMKDIPFVIVSNTTGEAHVVVTDKNGIVNTKTTRGNVNANDAAVTGLDSALTKDENGHYKLTGTVTVDESKLDASNGVWFGLTRDGSITEPNSALGALPYESTAGYSVLELPVMSNKDFQMIEDILLVDYEDDSKLLDWGTMDDVEPSISTTAYNGVTNDVTDHTFVVDDEVKLIDRVSYEECIPGREYTLTGELHYTDGSAVTIDGKPLTVTKTFTAKDKAGYELMELTFDGTTLDTTKDVVFYETLTYAGGSKSHNDPTDLNQTLKPKTSEVKTTAKATDGTKVVKLDKETTVVDTVSYNNLVVNYEYKLIAELMNKATGEAVLDAAGNAVKAEVTFTPEQSRDSIDVTLVFDGTKLDDNIDLVVYETLVKVKNGKTVADHKDITDEGQTVKTARPEIKTVNKDNLDGGHTAKIDNAMTFTDTIEYSNLIVGKEYVATGTLMLKSVDHAYVAYVKGEEFGAGQEVTANEDGTKFSYTSSTEDATIKETLTKNLDGTWTHTTVTSATESTDGEKTAETKDAETLQAADVEIKDNGTGEASATPYIDQDGKEVKAEATFTPDTAHGFANVTFTFNGLNLEDGTELVAYEAVTRNSTDIAKHEDPSDEGQTVKVVKPKLGTTATDGVDGDKTITANSEVKVVDTVAYSGLVPGREYTVSGTLMIKKTDHAYVAYIDGHEFGEGKEVKANADGTYFRFDTDSGYESLVKNADSTWTHATVNNEDKSNDESGSAEVSEQSNNTTETLQAADVEIKDNGTGEVTEEKALDANGKEITASTTFTPETQGGTVDVVFTFDGSKLQSGTELVVFESLTLDGIEIAAHADINDDAQKVVVATPKISTTATDRIDGDQIIVADEDTVVNDSVSYEDLSIETPYTIIGVLMDKTTNLPLITGENWKSIADKDLQSFWTSVLNALGTTEKKLVNEYNDPFEATDVDYAAFQEVLAKNTTIADAIALKQLDFTVDHTDGKIDVELAFDGSRFIKAEEAHDVVAYEFLIHDGKMVALHADINDGGQTVSIEPSNIGTTLVDSTDQDHIALPSTTTKLVDTVSYENLIPGKEYTVSGTLMDKSTGKALLVNDKEVTASTTFTPNKAKGSVEVIFEFDASALNGKTVVAFEKVTKDNIEVAVHEDINDEGQSVEFDKLGGSTPKTYNGTSGSSYSKTGVDMTQLSILIAILVLATAGMFVSGNIAHRRQLKAEYEASLDNDSTDDLAA